MAPSVAAMKPVAAGVDDDGLNEDVRLLMQAANVPAPVERVNPYSFAPPMARFCPSAQAKRISYPSTMKHDPHEVTTAPRY